MSLTEKISEHILNNCVTVGLLKLMMKNRDNNYSETVKFLNETVRCNINNRIQSEGWLYSVNELINEMPPEFAERTYDTTVKEYKNGYIAGFTDCIRLLGFISR